MIVTDNFEDIISAQDTEVVVDSGLGDFVDHKFGKPFLLGMNVPHWQTFGDTIGAACGVRGLDLQIPSPNGMYLVLDDGTQRRRSKVYAMVLPTEVHIGLRAIVDFIADRHGAGKWWGVRAGGRPPINYLIRRDATPGMIPSHLVADVPRVLLGCHYVHEKMPVIP